MGIIYCEKDRTFTLQTKRNYISDAGGSVLDFFFISIMVKRQKAAWIIF